MADLLPLLLPVLAIVGIAAVLYILKRPEVGFLLLALLAPVSNYLDVGPIKLVYLIGGCLLAGTLYKHVLASGPYFPKFTIAYGGITLGWIIYAWVAGGFAGGQTVVGLAGSVLIVCAVFLLYKDTAQMKKWLWLFAVGIAISNVVVAVLALTYPAARPFIFRFSSEGIRLQGTLGNPNMFGGAQVLAFSIFAFFIVRGKGNWLLNVLGLLVTFAALLGSQSRSAILGLFLGLGVVGLFMIRASRRPMATTGAILFGGVVLVLAFLNLPEEVAGFQLGRVSTTDETRLYEVGFENVVGDRVYIFEAAFETIVRNPFGVGHIPTEEAAAIMARNSSAGVEKMPHNFVLAYLLRYGIVGGIVMVLVWLAPVIMVIGKLWKGRLAISSLASLMLIGLVGYLIHNLFHSMTNWIYFWIFWGMCIRAAQLEDRRRNKR